jgi:hypothetical protein
MRWTARRTTTRRMITRRPVLTTRTVRTTWAPAAAAADGRAIRGGAWTCGIDSTGKRPTDTFSAGISIVAAGASSSARMSATPTPA